MRVNTIRGAAPGLFNALAVLSVTSVTSLSMGAYGQAVLTKEKRLAWDVIGLDSNDVMDGPDTFPVGQRVCNTGDADATNVTGSLQWQNANAYIALATGTPSSINFGTLAPGGCLDAYFNIQIDRDVTAYDQTRHYLIEFDSDQTAPISAPIDAANYNEIYIERLISQRRNVIDSIIGPSTVYQGETYSFTLNGSTATQGYEQLELFINFPNNIFRILSASATYSADQAGTVDDAVYTDACGWQHDPQNPLYFATGGTNTACASGLKEGGDITLDYTIEIIGTGNATVTALIHDFSGSSFHYNADYGSDILAISALPQPGLSIDDVSILEGDAGANFMVFTVSLDAVRADADVQFNFNTTGVTAAPGVDFITTTGAGTITAGSLSTTISVPITTELIYENDETFLVSLSNPVNASIADGSGEGTILNDDAVPGITVSDASIEEGGNLVFILSLSNPSNEAISGVVTPTTQTASALDFSTTAQNFTLPVGATSTSISVATTEDGLVETDETMRLVISAISSGTATGAGNFGTGTITDDDVPPPPPDVFIGNATISEGGTLSLPVSLSSPATEDISFNVVISGGSASGTDYSLITGSVTISSGSSAGTISISTVDDAIFEGPETVVVAVGTVTRGTLDDTSDTGTGTIIDNDGIPDLTGGDASTMEGGNLSFSISLSNPSASAIAIAYATTPGTASVSDYSSANSTVTFAPGETTKTITVPSIDDSIDEDTEMFSLSLSSSDSVNVLNSTLTGTITDDDGAPSVLISNASASEGDNLAFTITLSNPSANAIELQLATADGTAVAADYDNAAVTVTFPPGTVSQNATVGSTEDTTDELDETFSIAVASVVQGTVGDTSDSGTGTILDDDGAPSMDTGDASITEGGNLSFPITLSNDSASDITLTFRPSNGTASASDYTTTDVQITIPAGSTTSFVTIPTTADTIDESDETVLLAVQSVDSGSLSDVSDTGTGTITDDDGAPSVQIDDVSAPEGNSLSFTVSLSNPSDADITLQMGTANGTASGTDYDTSAFAVTIPAGETRVAAQVATVGDLVDESDETMTLFVSSVSAGTVSDFSDTGTGTIQDDDGAPSVQIGDILVTEGGALAFPITLSNPSGEDIVLEFQPTDLSASPEDYTNSAVQITIPAGTTAAVVSVPTTSDNIDEMDETLQLAVSSVVSGSVGDTTDTAIGTITDDDGAPDIDIGDTSITEGDTLSFPVTLSNPSTSDIVITFQAIDGTATSDDYTATPVQVTIPAGETSATVEIPTTDDTADEPDETLSLAVASIDSGSVGDSSDTAEGTIVDDDGAPSLSIEDASAPEGDDLVFEITLSNIALQDITVTLTPLGGTAAADDFDGSSVQITIPAGDTTATARVPTTVDDVDEPDETLTLSVTSVDAGTLTDASDTGTGTIEDAIRSILVDATAVCINDAPYLEYEITPVGFTPEGGATIEWVGSDDSIVMTLNDQALTRSLILWPEAEVDDNGRGINWPGWDWDGAQWLSVPSLVRPEVEVRISINPTETVMLNYPPATPACATQPRPGFVPPDSSFPGGESAQPIPTLNKWALLLLCLLLSGVTGYHLKSPLRPGQHRL